MVYRIGHFGYMSPNFDAMNEWYKNTFNLTEVDVLYSPKDEKLPVAKFYRIELGEEFVDHHSLLLVRDAEWTIVHHSSFEVEDFDTQLLGHYHLVEKGYENLWGVGRHVHGSQIFDYWRDTSDYIVEHYADGDMVNNQTAVTHAKAGNASSWGPQAPSFAPRVK